MLSSNYHQNLAEYYRNSNRRCIHDGHDEVQTEMRLSEPTNEQSDIRVDQAGMKHLW